MNIPRLFSLAILAAMPLLCGCVRESTEADVTVFQYESYMPWLALGVGMIVSGLGMLHSHSKWGHHSRWPQIGTLLAAGALVVAVAPSFSMNYVKVSDRAVEYRTGRFWFFPDQARVEFYQVAACKRVQTSRYSSSGKRRKAEYLEWTLAGGKTLRWNIDELVRAALPSLTAAAEARGLHVENVQPPKPK